MRDPSKFIFFASLWRIGPTLVMLEYHRIVAI